MTSSLNWREKRQHGESSRTWKLGRENIRTKEQVIRERSTARRENRHYRHVDRCFGVSIEALAIHLRRGSILENTTTGEAVKVNGA